jgi:hypothetical protein
MRVSIGMASRSAGMPWRHSGRRREGFQRRVSLLKGSIVNPLLLVLVVILILSVLGGGYGFRSGNTIVGAGGGLLGTILLIVLILALMGRIRL